MRYFALSAALLLSLLAGCRQPSQPVGLAGVPAEVHYAPAENLEHIDVALLQGAQKSVDFAAYSLTDLPVAEALMDAAQRGVHVRIYRDNVQSKGEAARATKVARKKNSDDDEDGPDANNLMARLTATPNVEVRTKRSKTLMHLKSYSVDDVLVRSGSANFSPTGEKRQDNDLVVMRDADSITRFSKNFEQIWDRTDNETVTR